jgi:hypothetical protein
VRVTCSELHNQLLTTPLVRFPFQLQSLPLNGIYFFYEKGESGHEDQRIVRIGTHKQNNFRSRIREHYLLGREHRTWTESGCAPHERSIFRKNLGRAILDKTNDPYLQVWEKDFTSREARQQYGSIRNIEKELAIESMVTELMRNTFSFRFVVIENLSSRMGSQGLESALIGTVAQCKQCPASAQWLGHHSPIEKIRESGLWLVQHLSASPLNTEQAAILRAAIRATVRWVKENEAVPE